MASAGSTWILAFSSLEQPRLSGHSSLWGERSAISKSQRPYPPEYRHKIVELVRSGRSIASVAREFELPDQTLRNWLKRDDVNAGRREDGLTTVEPNGAGPTCRLSALPGQANLRDSSSIQAAT